MKTLTTIEEIKAEAARDNDATFFIQLNEEVVNWLNSSACYGQNRSLTPRNIDTWAKRIEDGQWRMRACDMKINSSCNWLIDGHHRVYAVSLMKSYDLCARMTVIPDDEAIQIFGDQDCVGARRTVAQQSRLVGVSNSELKGSIDAYWRLYVDGDDSQNTVETTRAFGEAHKWYFDEQFAFLTLDGKHRKPLAKYCAAFIYAVEHRPEFAIGFKSAWRNIVTGEDIHRGMAAYALRKEMLTKETNGKRAFLLVLKALMLHVTNTPCFTLRLTDKQYADISEEWGLAFNGKNGYTDQHIVSRNQLRTFENAVRNESVVEFSKGTSK